MNQKSTPRIGSRWINKSNRLPVIVREVHPERNSIRLNEFSGCYTERLDTFLATFEQDIPSPADYERERRRHAQLMDIAAGYAD